METKQAVGSNFKHLKGLLFWFRFAVAMMPSVEVELKNLDKKTENLYRIKATKPHVFTINLWV